MNKGKPESIVKRNLMKIENEKSKDYCKADLKQRVLFLEIQRLQLAGFSSTVFAANLMKIEPIKLV